MGDHPRLRGLLPGLRTAGLGALVLLGVLFSVSFTSRFAGLSGVQRGMYATCVALASLATVLLLAPAAYLRRVPGRRPAEQVIRAVDGMAVGGLAATGLAVSAAARLAARLAASGPTADLIGAGTAVMFAVTWCALPRLLSRDSAQDRNSAPAGGRPDGSPGGG